jgi:hypothetical protein
VNTSRNRSSRTTLSGGGTSPAGSVSSAAAASWPRGRARGAGCPRPAGGPSPSARPSGWPGRRPAPGLEGARDRILDRVLGQPDVPDGAGQRGQHAPALVADHPDEGLARGIRRRRHRPRSRTPAGPRRPRSRRPGPGGDGDGLVQVGALQGVEAGEGPAWSPRRGRRWRPRRRPCRPSPGPWSRWPSGTGRSRSHHRDDRAASRRTPRGKSVPGRGHGKRRPGTVPAE